jgi:hypothetical protein
MKKAAAFAVVGSALLLVMSLALAHPDIPSPDGVAANAWIRLAPDAGFVVTGSNSEMVRLGGEAPSVTGYLMARRDGKWVRLDPESGARFIPTK